MKKKVQYNKKQKKNEIIFNLSCIQIAPPSYGNPMDKHLRDSWSEDLVEMDWNVKDVISIGWSSSNFNSFSLFSLFL